MKASDYIAKFLARKVDHVFGLQGGAVVHLFDSCERLGPKPVYMHHEQAAAMAAAAYSKVSERYGVCIVTTGPGATNAITGLLGAWQDSVPAMFISGQTRLEHMSYGKPVRQRGTQEAPILDLVRPIVKGAFLVRSGDDIPTMLQEAYDLSVSGRPGPVWIDVPVNLQWEDIQPREVEPAIEMIYPRNFTDVALEISKARRPLIVAGNGIRLAGQARAFRSFVESSGFAFVTTWGGADLMPSDHPLNLGIIGISGQPGANQAASRADLLLSLGTHLSTTHTSVNPPSFAPLARHIAINADRGELSNLSLPAQLAIEAHLQSFFEWFSRYMVNPRHWAAEEVASCKGMNVMPCVGSYAANRAMTERLPPGTVMVVDGGGTALYTGFQSSVIKEGSRLICGTAMSAMGSGLPEAVGACLANGKRMTTCLIGDGSLMLNLPTLATIAALKLPIKIFVLVNNGYLAIRHTQDGFLGGRHYGTTGGDLNIPNVTVLSYAFGITYTKHIEPALESDGPILCEIRTPEDQPMVRQGFREENGRFTPLPLSEMAFA